ncbi:hypothetical protein CKN86_02250 [Carnobacterium divergens]|uniref:hypothetical protein n=1 Tax=Carnobacterium divergens TaxID=2748 RepID=UPI000D4CAD84|nr:hypothetical protein [Carnobacterium divergens]MCO6018263.1 hypothetical protein [Carnobacterium divergens]TFI64609.1 hypothetical protein CKN62_02250 [Carnobacterium divergens]TFI91478.1 hypothetical protein CKN84_02250 [Carnobacterium divergens]TFJ06534.1 hypothetical protein CKN86_02250 [Carnobacterium divergens]TFJ07887.1 hypothetical protein CKN65_02255 [Carnobacterium divergens]
MRVSAYRSKAAYTKEEMDKMIDFADEQHIPLTDVIERIEKLMLNDMSFDEALAQENGSD